jgi:hypothetical protein
MLADRATRSAAWGRQVDRHRAGNRPHHSSRRRRRARFRPSRSVPHTAVRKNMWGRPHHRRLVSRRSLHPDGMAAIAVVVIGVRIHGEHLVPNAKRGLSPGLDLMCLGKGQAKLSKSDDRARCHARGLQNVVIVMAVHGQRRTPLATMRGAQRKKPIWNRSLRWDDLIIPDSPGAVECPPSQVPTELGAVDSDIE